MKKLLLASVLAIASFPGYAADNNEIKADDPERLDDCVLAPTKAEQRTVDGNICKCGT